MEKHYVLKGDPVSLSRCRVNFQSHRVFDNQKEIKLLTGISLRHQHGDEEVFDCPLEVDIIFYFVIPVTKSKKIRPGDYMAQKIDLDNAIKFLFDCGNRVIWRDDCIISSVKGQKRYAETARTEFTVRTL